MSCFLPKINRDLLKNNLTKYTKQQAWLLYPKANFLLISPTGQIKNAITGYEYKQYPNQQGYMMINVVELSGERRSRMVHRLVAETYFPLVGVNVDMRDYEINHIDANKNNNSVDNLEWVTRQENLQHARDNNLFKSTKIILTKQDVSDIIELKRLKFKIKEIASSYKVSQRYISFLTSKYKRSECGNL